MSSTIAVGDVVLCNSLLSSSDLTQSPDEILIAWTGTGSDRSLAMQYHWCHGSFAECAQYPVRCLTVLPDGARFDRTLLPFLASLAIADGGLQCGGFAAGQVVVINGATGQLGGAAMLLALARGAARVVATGRNAHRLRTLVESNHRVVTHVLSGEREQDAGAIRHLAQGPIDLVVDYLAETPTPAPTLAGFDVLRLGGTLYAALQLSGAAHRQRSATESAGHLVEDCILWYGLSQVGHRALARGYTRRCRQGAHDIPP
jgi:NADPH:quinone reductase-like Zn-dependent oxidoreductase